MRRRRVVSVVLLLAVGACGGGGGGGEGQAEEAVVSTTRLRVDNESVCAQLRAIREIEGETARLTEQVGRSVVAGADADTVLRSGEALAAHLAASAGDLEAAYASSVADAPAAVVDALEARGRARAESVAQLTEILGAATTGEEVSRLFEAIGAAARDAAAEQDAPAAGVLDRYTEAICDFSMSD